MLRLCLIAASVAFFGCENPFFLEARAAAICQHLPAQRFQVPTELREQYARLPSAMQQGLSMQRTFDFDVNAQLPPELKEMVSARFGLTSVRLTVVEGSAHLGFIDEAHLQLQPADGTGLEARQFDYLRTEAEPRVLGWNGEAFDVAAYLQTGNLKYSVALLGALPEGDVVVDVDACAEAVVKLDYL